MAELSIDINLDYQKVSRLIDQIELFNNSVRNSDDSVESLESHFQIFRNMADSIQKMGESAHLSAEQTKMLMDELFKGADILNAKALDSGKFFSDFTTIKDGLSLVEIQSKTSGETLSYFTEIVTESGERVVVSMVPTQEAFMETARVIQQSMNESKEVVREAAEEIAETPITPNVVTPQNVSTQPSEESVPVAFSTDELIEKLNNTKANIQELQGEYDKLIEKQKSLTGDELLESQDKANSLKGTISETEKEAAQLKTAINESGQADLSKLNSELNEAKNNLRESINSGSEGGLFSAAEKIEEITEKASDLKRTLDEINGKKPDVSPTEESKLTWSDVILKSKEFQTVLHMLPKPLQKVITTSVAAGSSIGAAMKAAAGGVKSLIKQSLKFIATPLGFCITAIVGGLMLLKKYFTSTAEGQRAWNVLSAATGSILKSLGDIAINLGKIIFSVCKNGIRFFTALGQFIGVTFVKYLSAPIKAVGALGKMLEAVLTFNVDNIKAAWSEITKGFKSDVNDIAKSAKHLGEVFNEGTFLKDFKEAASSIGKAVTTMFTEVNNAMDRARTENDLNREEVDERKKIAELDAQIAAKRNEIYDNSLSKEEKLKKLKEAQSLIDQKYQGQIEMAKTRAELSQQQLDAHENDLDAIKRNADMQLKVLQLEKKRASEKRFLTRQQASTEKQLAKEKEAEVKKSASESAKAQKSAAKETEKAAKEAAAMAKALADEAKIRWEEEIQASQRLRQAEDRLFNIEKQRIDLMDEGYRKTMALMELETKQAKLKLQRQAEDAQNQYIKDKATEFNNKEKIKKEKDSKYQVKSFDYNDDELLKEAQGVYDSIYNEGIAALVSSQHKKVTDEQDKFLKEYESFQHKKEELDKTHNDRIADLLAMREQISKQYAEGTDDYKAERVKFESSPEYASLSGSVLNEGEVEAAFGKYISNIIKSRQDEITQAIQKVDEKYQEGVAKLDFSIIQQSPAWDEIFTNIEVKSVSALKAIEGQILSLLESENLTAEQAKTLSDQLSKVRGLQIQKGSPFATAVQAGRNLNDARREYNEVLSTQQTARFKIVERNAKSADRTNAKGEAQYQKALKSLVPVLKDGKEEFITYEEYLERARKAQGDLTDAQMKMQSAVQKAGKDLSSIGDIGKKAFGIAEKLGADTSSYEAQSAMTALDGLSQMGSALSSLDFSNPMSFLNVSAYMDMASGLIDTITGVLGIFGVGKGNMAELQEEIDKLTDSNATLTTALDDLADEMADASVGDAGSVYDRQMQVLGQILDNDRKILQDTAAQWEKGSHSIASQVNKSASDALHRMGFSSLQQFLSADAETLKHLRAYATDDYNAVLSAIRQAENEHTGSDLEGKLDTYLSDANGKAEELLETYQEKVTGISFDSMYDNFKAKLKDMSSSASDFADDFKAYMSDAIVEALAENYNERLKNFYKKFFEAAKDGLTEKEKADLKEEYTGIYEDALKERDELEASGLIDRGSSNASGTTKGFAGMSQSTADELNGRFAQLQISGQQTANNTSAILGILQSQTQETTIDEVNTAFDSLSGVMNTSLNLQNQSLLELRGINQNTLESMRILGETRDLVTEIRNKTSNL